MEKQENFISEGHRSTFLHKSAIWNRTPPTYTSNAVLCVREGSRVPNLQTEFNYLDSFKSYGRFSDFVVPIVPMSSPSSPHCPCHPHIIPIALRRSPWSVVSVVSTCCPCGPHIVPVIPTSSRRSPHHPQPLRYPPHTPLGGGGPQISKTAIRFELIKIF